MEKSHVGLGHSICAICLHEDTVILLDKRLKNTLERNNFLGFDICEDCKKNIASGKKAFIELKKEASSQKIVDLRATLDKRTGKIYWINPEKLPIDLLRKNDFCFVEEGVIKKEDGYIVFSFEESLISH